MSIRITSTISKSKTEPHAPEPWFVASAAHDPEAEPWSVSGIFGHAASFPAAVELAAEQRAELDAEQRAELDAELMDEVHASRARRRVLAGLALDPTTADADALALAESLHATFAALGDDYHPFGYGPHFTPQEATA